MHHMRAAFGLGLLFLVGLNGCALTDQDVKPPRPPEEFRAPPESDPRYSRPIEYPKETMDQDVLLKKHRDASKGLPGPVQSPRGGAPRPTGGF